MWEKTFSIIILVLMFILMTIGFQLIPSCSANFADSVPTLSMPIENVNYTVASINGTLWAKIDGEYPIHIQNQFIGDLPMVYPMPPGTANINVTLDDRELTWSNYTQTSPDALHQTAIGNWWMIYSVLPNVSGFFTLKIHYEHPLEVVNGSYLFLYDLNISPYLSEQYENSSAYFTVRMDANFTDLHAYTALPDSTASEWKPMKYTTTTENSTKVVSILMYSEYPGVSGKSLPGDLVVEFSSAKQNSDFPLWIIAILFFAAFLLVAAFYVKRRKISTRL